MKIKVYNKENDEVLKIEFLKDGDLDCDYDMTFFGLSQIGDSITLYKNDTGEALFSMRRGSMGTYIDLLEFGYTIEIY